MMGKVIMSGIVPQLVAPVTGIMLSEFAEGSIVKINENGSPVEFYVACHNYESALNGTGRTLLVRKECYDQRIWDSDSGDSYGTSDIDAWLNTDYKSVLDADVQSAIATTTIYNNETASATAATPLTRSVFILSHTELGSTTTPTIGSALPIASMLKSVTKGGVTVNQWTRSTWPVTGGGRPMALDTGGGFQTLFCNMNYNSFDSDLAVCSRPCFTLPATALFDKETLLFKGVS